MPAAAPQEPAQRAVVRACDPGARAALFPRIMLGNRPPQVGFTLIEILVVMVIIAVTASVVTLAIGGAGGDRQLARDAERLRALLGYACEQAEISGREIGVSLSRSGYGFSLSDHDAWLPAGDAELRRRKWSVGPDAVLTRDGQRVTIGADFPEKPQLVCFSSGELTSFRLDLALPESSTAQRIEGQPDGRIDGRVVDRRAR